MTRLDPRLHSLFLASEEKAFSGHPIQFTDGGIWLPTPLDVIDSALTTFERLSLMERFAPPAKLLEAGIGDGRWVAALGLWSISPEAQAGGGFSVYGLECDEGLFALAESNLEALNEPPTRPPWRVGQGSYLDRESYRSLGIEIPELDIVLNYPDGNEARLGRFLSGAARPGTLLCLLTPDSAAGTEGLELEAKHPIERRLPSTEAPNWTLSIYRVPSFPISEDEALQQTHGGTHDR